MSRSKASWINRSVAVSTLAALAQRHHRESGAERVLPAFDATGLKIQQEASKTEPDTHAIEKMITCDPSLTSHVLRIANSTYYKGINQVSTVRGAIVRLGSREVANIAILVTQKKSFQSIAFPLIGAGSGGFNQERARETMLDELQKVESPLDVTVGVFKK